MRRLDVTHRHHPVFESFGYQPPVDWIGSEEARKQRHAHDDPEFRRQWAKAIEMIDSVGSTRFATNTAPGSDGAATVCGSDEFALGSDLGSAER